MKITAVGVTSSNISETVKFYKLLGFKFQPFDAGEDHVEPVPMHDSARLMIDHENMISEIYGEQPKPSNHSGFAIEYDSAFEVNDTVQKVEKAGYTVTKQPWDAPWGQRYAVVCDPDGYMVDLYAKL